MPILQVFTNLPKSKFPDGFLRSTVLFLAELTGKPKEKIVVHVIPDQLMIFCETEEPLIVCSFTSLGQFNPETNKTFSAALTRHLQDVLGVVKDRVFIKFDDLSPAFLGHFGTTKAALM